MEAVTHELKVMEQLPPRRTLLNEQLATIARNPSWYGKPVQIGSYAKTSAANGAKHLLQKRWGKSPEEHGWAFATRHIVEEGQARTGLFAIFTPGAVKKSSQDEVVEAAATAQPPITEAPAVAAEEAQDEEAPEEEAQEPQAEEVQPEPEAPRKKFTQEQLERLALIENLDEILAAVAPKK